jgi:hypothetical protein
MTATKKVQALVIYMNERREKNTSRKDIIQLFVRDLDMSATGAATYYQTVKKIAETATYEESSQMTICHVKSGFQGLVYFNVLGRVVGNDILAAMNRQQGVTHMAAYEYYSARTIAQYVVAQVQRSPETIAEEAAEMRAAFGEGAEVVNVFTGQRTSL